MRDLSPPFQGREEKGGGGGGEFLYTYVVVMYNKDTSVSGARRDVISSLLHYRDFITVIAKQCFVLSVWQDSTRAIRTLFDYHTMAFLSRTGAPDASRLSRKVCENGASPESCFLQRRIVIYIWTRETRTAKSAHINIFYRSCVLCVCPKNFTRIVARRCSRGIFHLARRWRPRVFGSSPLPFSRPKTSARFIRNWWTKEQVFYIPARASFMLAHTVVSWTTCGDIRPPWEHVSVSFCSLTGSPRISRGARPENR